MIDLVMKINSVKLESIQIFLRNVSMQVSNQFCCQMDNEFNGNDSECWESTSVLSNCILITFLRLSGSTIEEKLVKSDLFSRIESCRWLITEDRKILTMIPCDQFKQAMYVNANYCIQELTRKYSLEKSNHCFDTQLKRKII